MLKRLLLCQLFMLASLLPLSQAQSIPTRGSFIPLSTYRDDPFVAVTVIEQMDAAKFGQSKDGRPPLTSAQAWVEGEPVIFRLDINAWELTAFA